MAKRGNTIETRCAYAQGMTEKQQIKIYGVTAKDPTFFTRVRTKEENRLEEARRAVISAEALAEAWNQVRNHPESMEAGLKSLITHDGYGAGLPIDAENLQYRFLGLAHAEMVDFIDQNRARWLGFKYNHEGMRDIMREIFGENTNNADASDLAKQYKSGMVILEKFLYNAGVDVKAVRGVLVPEGHTSWRLSEYNADEYLDIVKNLVDYTKYVDSETGLLMPPADVNSWLRASFNNAISNGSYTRKEESIRQLSSPMAVLVGKETRIHFKNANAWLEYQAKFGEENIFINL